MSVNIPTDLQTGIRVGELIWPAMPDGSRAGQQERQLIGVLDMANLGLIVDCTLVEIGNSEIINVLMRVRNYAKKKEKAIVLLNSPETLVTVIRMCNLGRVLPMVNDSASAKKMINDQVSGKAGWIMWLESHIALSALIAVTGIVSLCVAGYMLFR